MGWFGRKKRRDLAADVKSRYAGKPLLIILENYVLDAIGELPSDKASLAASVVQQVYGGGDDWKATLRKSLALGDSLDEHLRELWQRNQDIAAAAGTSLTAEDFARMVVDENFAHLLDEKDAAS